MDDSCSTAGNIICSVRGSKVKDLTCSSCRTKETEDPVSAPKQISCRVLM